jgi:hypothetical protein
MYINLFLHLIAHTGPSAGPTVYYLMHHFHHFLPIGHHTHGILVTHRIPLPFPLIP